MVVDSTQLRCPQCGADALATQAFCSACGLRLAAPVQPAPGVPPPQWQPGLPPPPPAPGTNYPPGYLPYYTAPPASETPDATGGIIPYKNPKALIAYYCAVFALIPGFGLVLGPIALGMGLAGWRYYKQHPAVKGAAHAWIGIVLGGLCALFNLGGLGLMIYSMLRG